MNKPIKHIRPSAGTIALAASLICLLVYLRALSCDFINWDDPLYVLENSGIRILDWQLIREAFTTSYLGWWMPLTWISFAVDYHFWGLNPLGYHLINVLLHAVNTGLVVLIAGRLLRPGPEGEGDDRYLYPATLLLAGLLWGIHPLRVESVAWVTERKDVLNGLFSLGSILSYLHHVEHRDGQDQRKGISFPYLLSLVLFLLSLMAKPVSVVIPVMLLVMDCYPLQRLTTKNALKIIAEKLPFLIIALIMVVFTLSFASGETILVSLQDFPLYRRLILAGNSLFEYLRMTVYPVGLINIYLLPRVFPVSYYPAALGVLVFSCYCCYCCKRRPWLLATWLLFLLPLIPVLGFFQNGAQAYADRFTYLPAVALSIFVAGLLKSTISRRRGLPRLLVMSLAVLIPIILGTVSIHLIGAWKNPETLWSRVIAIQPVGRAYYHRADYRLQTGRYLEAAEDLSVSIRMGLEAGFPGVFNLHALRGDALSRAGDYGEAVRELSEAIGLNPYPNYFYHRGRALDALGKKKEAAEDFLRAGNDTGPIQWQAFQ
ncbi:MAG TPA: tetratricopeptide repeat protein [Desulfuromonadaceae bacterium]|jgi:hypothetical protein